MKLMVQGSLPPINLLPHQVSNRPQEVRAILTDTLTLEVKQIKQAYPTITLIIFQDLSWPEIFQHKVHLTISPKDEKFQVRTLDGAEYLVTNLELSSLINKLLQAQYYRTELVEVSVILNKEELELVNTYPQYFSNGQSFGTFALRKHQGFITSTRGKKQGLRSISYVQEVNHESLLVKANVKATLNAPLLDKIFKLNPHLNFLLHGHELQGKIVHPEYEFAGTVGDLHFATKLNSGEMVQMPYHGFLIGFSTWAECQQFIQEQIWNQYQARFPVRYLETGLFDEKVLAFLQGKRHLRILDLGGGEHGNKILYHQGHEVFFLDPYVKNLPSGSAGRITWDTQEKFDLIVARGCINYLTPKQLTKIPLLLNKQGTFLANTFLKPPSENWQERSVENSQGIKGIERIRLQGQVVEHQTIFPDYQVNHQFFYYSLEEYFTYFKVLGYQKYGKNSAILFIPN